MPGHSIDATNLRHGDLHALMAQSPETSRSHIDGRSILLDISAGAAVAGAAVALRYAMPLPPDVLPTLTVVIALSIITVFLGLVAGVTTALVGGLLCWYLFFAPFSWDLGYKTAVGLAGYAAVSGVILVTSLLYRISEQRRRGTELTLARQDVERAELFAREMAHRLKNALAIVQALASQTFRDDSPDFAKFAARLKTLSGAHNLLNEHIREPTAPLDQVVNMALEPFAHWTDRIQLSGPKVVIRDQQVVAIALALHELGTNAVKYGALSNGHGRIDINWTGSSKQFELEWKEHDGPPVSSPERNGFGTKLLARSAMRSKLAFEPDGIRCSIRSE